MKPFNATSLIKTVNKSVPNVSVGFSDPQIWLSTGCYLLNYLISGDYKKGIPLEGKISGVGGESGAGKSYIVSGNLVKSAQEKGAFVILFDTENALDEQWLHNLGVDTSEDKLMRINVAMIDDVSKTITKILEEYEAAIDGIPYEEQQPLLFIIDSLGMLMTPSNARQFEDGDMKGDMGWKAKQLSALMRGVSAKITKRRIGVLYTNHVYASQDQYTPDTLAGGKMVEYATSIIIQMNKLLLKEDEFGNKLADGEVAGIRSSVVVRKTRYNKPFEKMKIEIPYEQGMNPYSGLFDFFLSRNILIKEGHRYSYTSPVTGEILKDFRKNFKHEWLDQIMEEWEHWTKHVESQEPVEVVED